MSGSILCRLAKDEPCSDVCLPRLREDRGLDSRGDCWPGSVVGREDFLLLLLADFVGDFVGEDDSERE